LETSGGAIRAEMTMRIRFAYWYAVILVLGGALLTASAISYLPDVLDAGLLLIFGPLMFVLGILIFGPVPYISIRDSEVVLPLAWGGKWHRIPRGKNLRVQGDQLIAVRDGRTKAVAKRWLANKDDWAKLAAELSR
jgi:hypothetical protein